MLKEKIKLKNNVNTNLDFSYSIRRSDRINAHETNSFKISSGFNYRMSKNFVLKFNVTVNMYKDITEISNDYNEVKASIGGNIIF